mgnify:CR=1 FL=1
MGSAFHNPGNYFPFFGKNDSSLCSRRGAGVYNCDSGFCRNERKYKVGITKGSFEEMRYTRPGDYKYTVYQLKGENKEVIYDDSVYEVTVRVVNTQENGLAAEVWAVKDQSDQKTDEIKFINQYKETTTATTEAINNTIHHTTTNTITKSSIGTSSPKTGDKSNVMLWGGIAILSGLCVFFFLFEGKRRKTEE